MIDDDFETVFRRLFESLMNSMGSIQDGETTVQYWSNSSFGPGMANVPEVSEDIQAEVIDLEDRVLFLVEVGHEDELIDVKVEGRTLKVFDQVEGNETVFDLDFDVDIENSRTSCRNGIVEIELKKTDDTDGQNEGYLKID
ncbi:MAG: Hsp20/alpha crystallin family protein [Candidatus Thorarchaeota archaeon]|nr:Hsp20/alpha crystallin family protein [Candidatus Thorarchaeota archaeon]